MRIIAGEFRGVPLLAPPGLRTRPITDRAKETLFNILGSRFETPGGLPDVDVLDVFAGSGSLGLEALSRGARNCIFVERDRSAAKAIEQNVAKLRAGPRCRIVRENAWAMRPPAGEFGLIFVDPPYRDAEDPVRVSDLLDRFAGRLGAGGLLVLRYEGHGAAQERVPVALVLADERMIGAMHILLLARR